MPKVSIDRLQPGVFISLAGVSWLDHPFLLNRFRVSSAEQIKILREMGLASIEWDPARSTAQPLPENTVAGAASAVLEEEPDFAAPALGAMLDVKRQRAETVRAQREGLARCERLFEQETNAVGDLFRELGSRPNEAHARAKGVVGRVVDELLQADSTAVHLVNMKSKEPGLAHHCMNVMVLSLLIGKTMKASAEELRALGLGAMLHDIGKQDIPARVLRSASRSPSEEQFYQAHVGYGIKNIAAMSQLAVTVKNIIACHHERWDGQGFPNRLAGAKIPRLARMTAIANRYDNLCNPFDLRSAKTPAEAIAQMYKQESAAFEPELLQAFIKSLGVYPPGSFVSLSDGSIGLVVETNSTDLLKPVLMLHDPGVPRQEALLIDLRDADLAINGVVSPAKLPPETVEYLAPRGRIDYYVDAGR